MKSHIIPHPKMWRRFSWTLRTLPKIKCSLRSPQTLRRTARTQTEFMNTYNHTWTSWKQQHYTRWLCLTLKWWTPLGSSSSFSNDTAQLSTLLAGPASPPGVPGRLELLPPQPRADMLNSAAQPTQTHPFIGTDKHDWDQEWNQIFPSETHRQRLVQLRETLVLCAYLHLTPPGSVHRNRYKIIRSATRCPNM